MAESKPSHAVDESQSSTVSDLPEDIAEAPALRRLADVPVPEPIKDPVEEDDLEHRQFEEDAFWRRIPAFREITTREFLDHRFQANHTATNAEDLAALLQDVAPASFLEDVREGLRRAPMNLRVTPYVAGLIDWDDPYDDPLRIQFIPVASTLLPDHPRLALDSLHEQEDSPTPGLVHRYPDKVLFLPLDVCPVYCRFCTRSYAIGSDTAVVDKVAYKPRDDRWDRAFAYIASRTEIEDVVVSGGDTYVLAPKKLRIIGETLLAIPHVRRIRFASKGPAVMPMKILSDPEWTGTLVDLVQRGRQELKEVCLHTHFNCTNEITDITRRAMSALFRRGVRVRNQSVLIRGVNDSADEMVNLVRQLSYMNVQPYYVYQHDMVKGVEDLRTRLADTLELERHVRGTAAGFNTPTFVTDVPGGGGKRDAHSFDHYDDTTGVAVYRSPSVDDSLVYLYFDPLHTLPEEGHRRWEDPGEHDRIVSDAIAAAGLGDLEPA
jgi:lysine 2,3-aminomutase